LIRLLKINHFGQLISDQAAVGSVSARAAQDQHVEPTSNIKLIADPFIIDGFIVKQPE
jgi:hypothetical protein